MGTPILCSREGAASVFAEQGSSLTVDEVNVSGSNPASTGPAGAHFESEVGAHYLLTMLAASEPRGLPGTSVLRVEFQRGDEGFPLDDVIVHARDVNAGKNVSLQIQVKRSITFSANDAVFKKTVSQIAKAISGSGFWEERNELAIATARTSRKIDAAYQDVLRWARQLGSAKAFFDRLNRSGAGNDDMRTFVRTLRDHLRDAGANHDDETVWKVLARLQILVFDYTAVGSANAELSRDRCMRVLSPETSSMAPALWNTLISLTETVAADAGDRDLPRLRIDLSAQGFAFAPRGSSKLVRDAVSEASALALADMECRIGECVLTRKERLDAVNVSLETGRYVEIRGDAGVGKSGILRQIAELYSVEGRVIVLSPGRTPLRGWPAMRVQLSFQGSIDELLFGLCEDGGAALFIDNLDSFGDEERKTVNDLLRAAARTPGMVVIATARQTFGIVDPSWLDLEAIRALVPGKPVIVDELIASEVNELGDAEPRLAPLLADSHPARQVVRNLYRLSRQASQPSGTPVATSELDMAAQWWNSADGAQDAGYRERARVLRSLARLALRGEFVMDASSVNSVALDGLIRSETLRDHGNDQVSFKHDVLRQWAIGNLLAHDDSLITELPMSRPASAVLGRGVELAARFSLEKSPGAKTWAEVLNQFSGDGIHGSWRRAGLLSIVHSEDAIALLRLEADRLLENNAALLREIIRTVMAVDVSPASALFLQIGITPEQVPPGMFVPNQTSWLYLIIWLVELGAKIPAVLLDDVAELYTNWMLATFGSDPLTPALVGWMHAWLVEIESDEPAVPAAKSFIGSLGFYEQRPVADKLRTGLLFFASKRPDLAVDYLERLRQYQYDRGISEAILKFRGTLAQAAPRQLAALTEDSLLEKPSDDPYHRSSRILGPFTYLDSRAFLPSGPSQGPFLELLTHSTPDGFALVRKLVDHAIEFATDGRPAGDDGIRLVIDSKERFFPWQGTYRWSRGDSYYAIGSGLMAIEAWAHQCIEAGADFDEVLKMVLGEDDAPAAYLLIAVDLIISHWPQSKAAAAPFLSSPELLSAERNRQARDQFDTQIASGNGEPRGPVTAASLRRRPSRQWPLESLLPDIALNGPEELRRRIDDQLRIASERLGHPAPSADFTDPALMVSHARNLLDPKNWKQTEVTHADRTTASVPQYVPPEAEANHIAMITEGDAARLEDANVKSLLTLAMNNPTGVPEDLVVRGVNWAQRQSVTARVPEDEESDETFVDTEAMRAAALLLLRYGSSELQNEHDAWAEEVMLTALTDKDDSAHRFRGGLMFNPVATAFVGLAALYLRQPTTKRLQYLLEIAARESPAGSHGFADAIEELWSLDERLPQAVLRCAFSACVKTFPQWDDPEATEKAKADYRARMTRVVAAELAWLTTDQGNSPEWPIFETEYNRRTRQRSTIGGVHRRKVPKLPPAEIYVDGQAAALWLGAIQKLSGFASMAWVRSLLLAYSEFSARQNGLGMQPDQELSKSPYEWNNQYYELLAKSLVGLTLPEVERLALEKITALPDEPFFDVLQIFLRAVDVVYFSGGDIGDVAPAIRSQLTERLMSTRGWQYHVGRPSGTIEVHLGPALATILFNDYVMTQTSSYLNVSALKRFHQFVPQMTDFLASSPSYFVAIFAMNTIEKMPDQSLLPMLTVGVQTWLKAFPGDTDLWIERRLGRRVCAWLETIYASSPDAFAPLKRIRAEIDSLLSALVRAGVPEARQLEDKLSEE